LLEADGGEGEDLGVVASQSMTAPASRLLWAWIGLGALGTLPFTERSRPDDETGDMLLHRNGWGP